MYHDSWKVSYKIVVNIVRRLSSGLASRGRENIIAGGIFPDHPTIICNLFPEEISLSLVHQYPPTFSVEELKEAEIRDLTMRTLDGMPNVLIFMLAIACTEELLKIDNTYLEEGHFLNE